MKTETSKASTIQSETFNEGLNVAKKWFNETNTRMADAYNKQIRESFEFFNSLINPMVNRESTGWFPGENITELFTKNSEIFFKNLEKSAEMSQQMINSTFTAFNEFNKENGNSNGTVEAILESYEKQVEQMVEYNKKLFSTIGKEYSASQSDMDTINKKFEQKLKNDFETSRNAVKKFIETNTTKNGFSLEANTKLVQEINGQIEKVVENNKAFWADILKTFEAKKSEEKKQQKESVKVTELVSKK